MSESSGVFVSTGFEDCNSRIIMVGDKCMIGFGVDHYKGTIIDKDGYFWFKYDRKPDFSEDDEDLRLSQFFDMITVIPPKNDKQGKVNRILLDAAYEYLQHMDDKLCIEWCKIYLQVFELSPICEECGSVGNYLSEEEKYKCECGNVWRVNKAAIKKPDNIIADPIQRRLNKVIEG